MLNRDEIATTAVRDAREIVGLLDDAKEITADGDQGGNFLLALAILALEQQAAHKSGQLQVRASRLDPGP